MAGTAWNLNLFCGTPELFSDKPKVSRWCSGEHFFPTAGSWSESPHRQWPLCGVSPPRSLASSVLDRTAASWPCSCNSLLTRPKPCIRRLFLSSFIKREFLWVRCAELWASLSVSHLLPSVSPSFPPSSRCDSSCLIKTQQVPSSSPDTFYSPCFLFNWHVRWYHTSTWLHLYLLNCHHSSITNTTEG